MYYQEINCPNHSGNRVNKICLFRECRHPLLCDTCSLNHELDHQNFVIPIAQFTTNSHHVGLLGYFQHEHQRFVWNLKDEINRYEDHLRKQQQRIFKTLQSEINHIIYQQELKCQEAMDRFRALFLDQVKLFESKLHVIQETIETNIPIYKNQKRKMSTDDEYKILLDEVHLYHQIEPKQKQLKYEVSMVNMDLQHTKAVVFYEENLPHVMQRITGSIIGANKLVYIEQQFSQPKIPLIKNTIQQPYVVERIKAHDDWVTAVCPLNEKTRVATGSSDKEIKIFDLNTKEVQYTFTGHTEGITAILFHWKTSNHYRLNPLDRLISASQDRTIMLWDMETYKQAGSLIAHTGPVTCLCLINDDSNNIASCGQDKKVVIWTIDAKIPGVLCELDEHKDAVHSVCSFRYNERVVVASASADKTIRITDYIRRVTLVTLQCDNFKSLAYQGKYLFAGGQSGDIAVWDVETQTMQKILKGHEGPVNGIISVNNNDYIVSASWDQSVIVWNVHDASVAVQLTDGQHYCHGICYLNDGETFVTCSADGNLRMWFPDKADQVLTRLKTQVNENLITENHQDAARPGVCSTKTCNIF